MHKRVEGPVECSGSRISCVHCTGCSSHQGGSWHHLVKESLPHLPNETNFHRSIGNLGAMSDRSATSWFLRIHFCCAMTGTPVSFLLLLYLLVCCTFQIPPRRDITQCVLLSHKKEQDFVTCSSTDRCGEHFAVGRKPNRERRILCDASLP